MRRLNLHGFQVQRSSISDDYKNTIIGEENIEGYDCWIIQLIPNEDAPVVSFSLDAIADASFAEFLPKDARFQVREAEINLVRAAG